MTWKEFKEKVESQNVKDNDKIRWIDVDSYIDIEVRHLEDGEITIG